MRRVAYLLVGIALVAATVTPLLTSQNLDGHRLVGSWETPPKAIAPQMLTFGADGAGMDASGVGNFPFRWRPRGEDGDAVRVRVRYTGGAVNAFGETVKGLGGSIRGAGRRDWDVEFLGPDAIRVHGTVLHRRK
jgi:hypothetical protein